MNICRTILNSALMASSAFVLTAAAYPACAQVNGYTTDNVQQDDGIFPVYGPHGDIRGDEWTGTFDSNYGELRLIQVGRRVYGEYAKRGYFEGCVHNSGLTLRGTYQYFEPRSRQGYFEFHVDGDGFEGRSSHARRNPPSQTEKIDWRGARSRSDVPQTVYRRANEISFFDRWPDITAANREWVLGSYYYDSCDPPDIAEEEY